MGGEIKACSAREQNVECEHCGGAGSAWVGFRHVVRITYIHIYIFQHASHRVGKAFRHFTIEEDHVSASLAVADEIHPVKITGDASQSLVPQQLSPANLVWAGRRRGRA